VRTPDSRASELRALLGPRIILPADPAYDNARLAWNRAAEQRPAAVAVPHTAAEVIEVVRAAAACDLRVTAQSTGHAAGALSGTDLSDTVLISMTGLRGVTIDPVSRTATVAGGTVWHDVLQAAAPHGLTAVHGSAGDISVVGYTLGGGLSFYGRRHGLAANIVRSVSLVNATGDLVTANAEENADLFWAIRGGAGGFGVVVELEIDLLDYADVFAGMLLWDASHADEVSRRWAAWTADVPESVTTSMRIMHFPPLPELPPFVRGRSVAVVDGALLEGDTAAAEILRPLRALDPEVDTFTRIPTVALVHMHMDPPEPSPATSAHAMLHALPGDAVTAFVEAAMTARPMISELRHAGGAIAREAPGGGAVSSLHADYVMAAIAMIPDPHLAKAAGRSTHAVVDGLAGWHAPGLAATFIDEPGVDPRRIFGSSFTRLVALKHRHDPRDMFVTAHPLV
jgi:FAD/FMN-containing dehydrogenase